MNSIIFEGRTINIDAARMLMDDELCETIHGIVDTEQDFFDHYLICHQQKYGTSFVVN
jgi:hypothetical protein